ncbi:DUF4185 domain-containing protein [Nocardioides sp.]|uniref:DUF4185 domain-containing protein n=1 Tax=Nocardioides sp. TaxID=35761 RepID=UPI00262E1D4C|nr:DUF4185 domain-containing protein [Nocardioides sp.]MDI6912340.1 DUF4185 domain-containing protein [Nocardioides sp.]
MDRPTLHRLFPRRVAIVCAAVLVVQGVGLALLVRDVREPRPHQAPVAVVGPAVVAQGLAEQVNALEGRPLDVTAGADRERAVDDVRHGVTVGAALIDLTGTRDQLVLNGSTDERLARAVRQQAEAIERSHGRTLSVRRVTMSEVEGDVVRRLAVGFGALGFLVALALSLRFGPTASTLRLGTRRVLAVAAISLVSGYAAAVLMPGVGSLDTGAQLRLAGVLALTAAVAATVTLALEGVAGFGGLGLSGAFYLVVATPQLLGTDPHLLPAPWPALSDWLPPGASDAALAAIALYGGTGIRLPLLVLGVWLLAAVLGLLVSRRERVREQTAPDAGLDAPLLRHPPLTPVVRHGRLVRWRWRVGVVVLPAAAAAFVLVSFVPRDDVADAAPVASRASETQCVSTGTVRSVADLNRVVRTVRGGPEFQGGDVGADTELQDGRRLMVFGDTLRSPAFDGQRFVRNSMLVIGGDCIQAVLPEDHGALIPDRPSARSTGRVGYWPMSVVTVTHPGYDLVVVTAQRVWSTGTGDAFGFENLGPAVAVFVVPRGETPQLVAVRDVGPDAADITRPEWGAAAVVEGDWLYLYGTANPDRPYVFGFSLRVARVHPDDVLRPAAWEYWSGTDWVADPARSAELIPAEGGTSQTLSVFRDGEQWYALSKRDEFLGTDVVVWTAPDPWGPFDGGRAVTALPSDAAQGRLRYLPLAHPGLLPEPGTVVVSFSRNRTDVDEVVEDPTRYRPGFLRVDLP